jgi:hypothetical protein
MHLYTQYSGTYNYNSIGLRLWVVVMETTVDHSSTKKVIFYLHGVSMGD